MGHYIFSYGIKADKIKAAFGSKDKALLQTIEGTQTYKNYKDFLPDGYKTSPSKALKDIINGEEFDEQSGFAYGYALICMCEGLGENLSWNEIKVGYETDLINEYLDKNFGIKDAEIELRLFMDSHPFVIPEPDDFPMIGLLSNSELIKLKELLKNVVIKEEDMEDSICEHIRDMIKNIDYCIANNLELISFCH